MKIKFKSKKFEIVISSKFMITMKINHLLANIITNSNKNTSNVQSRKKPKSNYIFFLIN